MTTMTPADVLAAISDYQKIVEISRGARFASPLDDIRAAISALVAEQDALKLDLFTAQGEASLLSAQLGAEEAASARLLARIAELDHRLLRRATVVEEQKARIAELEELLRFVERWANHHGANPRTTPQEVLSMIQHHPDIVDITRSYVDGKVPETFNPYARIAELHAAMGTPATQGSISDSPYLGAVKLAAERLAAQPVALPDGFVIRAKPLEWEEVAQFKATRDKKWTDRRMGFHIAYDPDDDEDARYSAAWGEGETEFFATLDAAKEWCQGQVDDWIGKNALPPNAALSGPADKA